MTEFADVLRAGVAACLLATALLKWAAPTDLVAASGRLGVPASWFAGGRGRALRPGLVAFELLLAVAMVVPVTAQFAAMLASVLALGFAVLLALAVRRGEKGDCGCLGGVGGKLGWPVVLRNSALGIASIAAASQPMQAPFGVIAAGAVVTGLALAFGLLARAYRQRPLPVEVPGQRASLDPAWTWRLADGTSQPAAAVLNGRAGLLLFTDPDCAPCKVVLAHLRSRLPQRDDRSLTVISRGGLLANQRLAEDLGSIPVVVQDDFEIARAMGVPGTPTALQVTGAGARLGEPVSGAQAVNELVGRVFAPFTVEYAGGRHGHGPG